MDVVVATNVAKKIGIHAIPANAFVLTGGVLCAKASMLLQVSFTFLFLVLTPFLYFDGVIGTIKVVKLWYIS